MTHEQRMELAKSFLSSNTKSEEIEVIEAMSDKLSAKAKRGSRVAAVKRQQKFIEAELDQEVTV